MKKPLLGMLLVVMISAVGYLWWDSEHSANGHDRKLYGNVDIREVSLAFRVGGRLAEMLLEEGDQVKKGQEIAVLDDRPQRENHTVALAQVSEAQARLALLEAGSRPQEVERARAAVREAQAALDNAVRELERQKELVAKGLGSQRLLDVAHSDHDQWQARLASVKQALALALEGFRPEDIQAARAGLQIAEANLARAQTALDDTRLLAPNDGTVFTRVREPGSMVGAGMPVYTLSLDSTVYVRAYINEMSLGKIVPGARVWVHTDSSDKRYEGQVGFVSPRAEFTPKSVETPKLRTDLVYRLRIVVADADDGLRQGMPVTLEFDSGP